MALSYGRVMLKRDLAREAFATDEGFKATAARLGASPNTLRKWWKEDFGEGAFQERARKVQAQGAAKFNRGRKGLKKNIRQETVSCEGCGAHVVLSVVQTARLKRILCTSCDESERGVDRRCPVCGVGCAGVKGLASHMTRPQNGDLEAHRVYLGAQKGDPWEGKAEGRDFVRCLVCGHRGARIDRHLSSEHGLGLLEYRVRFPEAPVQADRLREAKAESAVQQHTENPRKGQKRVIRCPSCSLPREVGLTFAPSVHEEMCPDCVDEARWGSKVEGKDYVVCQECGHRAASLVSHIRNAHPDLEGRYLEEFPGARVLSTGASSKSDWNRRTEANSWRTGLTKETDERVAASAEKLAVTMSEVRANKFWRSTDLIELTSDQLDPFKLKNGKVSVGKAMAALGHAFVTIQRECHRLGLEVSRGHIKEAACLDLISQVLGGAPFETEWSPDWALNPETGWHFRYDGYFPNQNLIVEFHGYQHWTFPSYYIETREKFEALQARDALKETLAKAADIPLLVVREDEPWQDLDHLRTRVAGVIPL
jgi:predicted transcriptional regulator